MIYSAPIFDPDRSLREQRIARETLYRDGSYVNSPLGIRQLRGKGPRSHKARDLSGRVGFPSVSLTYAPLAATLSQKYVYLGRNGDNSFVAWEYNPRFVSLSEHFKTVFLHQSFARVTIDAELARHVGALYPNPNPSKVAVDSIDREIVAWVFNTLRGWDEMFQAAARNLTAPPTRLRAEYRGTKVGVSSAPAIELEVFTNGTYPYGKVTNKRLRELHVKHTGKNLAYIKDFALDAKLKAISDGKGAIPPRVSPWRLGSKMVAYIPVNAALHISGPHLHVGARLRTEYWPNPAGTYLSSMRRGKYTIHALEFWQISSRFITEGGISYGSQEFLDSQSDKQSWLQRARTYSEPKMRRMRPPKSYDTFAAEPRPSAMFITYSGRAIKDAKVTEDIDDILAAMPRFAIINPQNIDDFRADGKIIKGLLAGKAVTSKASPAAVRQSGTGRSSRSKTLRNPWSADWFNPTNLDYEIEFDIEPGEFEDDWKELSSKIDNFSTSGPDETRAPGKLTAGGIFIPVANYNFGPWNKKLVAELNKVK